MLDHPLMLAPGDEVHVLNDQQVVIKCAAGNERRPAGYRTPWCWTWRLL
ncbi:hypothetical protein [Streptomyces collinus]